MVDTNIIVRRVELNHPHQRIAQLAVEHLVDQKESLFLLPQNLREFWNVATRPLERNGLGMSREIIEVVVAELEAAFTILEDGLPVYHEWRRLVFQHNVQGAQVHDCYITAAMRVHGLTRILTFNGRDFLRYGLTVVDPADV